MFALAGLYAVNDRRKSPASKPSANVTLRVIYLALAGPPDAWSSPLETAVAGVADGLPPVIVTVGVLV